MIDEKRAYDRHYDRDVEYGAPGRILCYDAARQITECSASYIHARDRADPKCSAAFRRVLPDQAKAQREYCARGALQSAAGGIRKIWDDRRATIGDRIPPALCSYGPVGSAVPVLLGGPPDPVCRRPLSGKFDDETWTLGARYEFTDNVMAYVSASRGYRSGGFNARAGGNDPQLSYEPETVISYEAGLKSKFDAGIPMRLNIAIYQQDYSDIQRNNIGAGFTFIDNATKARIRGGEIEWQARFGRDFSASAFYGMIRPKYTSDDSANGGAVYVGTKFTSIVRDQIGASLNYDHTLDNGGSIYANYTFSWNSGMTFDKFERGYNQGTWTVSNARVGWRNIGGRGFNIAAYVTNIFDEVYSSGGNSLQDGFGDTYVAPAPPRQFGIEMGVTF